MFLTRWMWPMESDFTAERVNEPARLKPGGQIAAHHPGSKAVAPPHRTTPDCSPGLDWYQCRPESCLVLCARVPSRTHVSSLQYALNGLSNLALEGIDRMDQVGQALG